MQVLAIETSCDESAVAILDEQRGLLAHELWSQIDLHRVFGGVVPELASRDHVRRLLPLVRTAMARAQVEAVAPPLQPDDAGKALYRPREREPRPIHAQARRRLAELQAEHEEGRLIAPFDDARASLSADSYYLVTPRGYRSHHHRAAFNDWLLSSISPDRRAPAMVT